MTACGGETSSDTTKANDTTTDQTAAEQTDTEQKYRIGISCVLMQNEFFAEQIDWFYKICEEKYPNFEIVSVLDANLDLQKDLDNVAIFVSQEVDLIICSLSDFNAAGEIIQAANGIPVVFTNRQPTDLTVLEQGKNCYVGTDEYAMGYLQGEYCANKLKELGETSINYLNLEGELGAQNSTARAEGEVAALEASGLETNCLLNDACSWSRIEALSKTEQVIGAGKKINCVVTGCDEIALGAIEALKAAGYDMSTVAVGGIDGIAAAYESIANGELSCTAIQIAQQQAATALECAEKIFEGTLTETVFTIDPVLVTADHVAEFKN